MSDQRLTVIQPNTAVVTALNDRSAELLAVLPSAKAVERFKSVALRALIKSPELAKCTPESVVGSILEAAMWGLEPTGAAGGAHLVKFSKNVGTRDNPRYEDQAQLILDYRGVVRLVTKPPSDVLAIQAFLVREGDTFRVHLGSETRIDHEPSLAADRSTRAITHSYTIAHIRGGLVLVSEPMDHAELDAVRKRAKSGAYGPWATDEGEMDKKTSVKRFCKLLPITPEVAGILAMDDEHDFERPTLATPPQPAGRRTEALKDRLRPTPTPQAEPPMPTEDPQPERTADADGVIIEGEAIDTIETAQDAQPASESGLSLPQLIKVAGEAMIGLTDLNKEARKMFDGRTINLLTYAERARLWTVMKPA